MFLQSVDNLAAIEALHPETFRDYQPGVNPLRSPAVQVDQGQWKTSQHRLDFRSIPTQDLATVA